MASFFHNKPQISFTEFPRAILDVSRVDSAKVNF